MASVPLLPFVNRLLPGGAEAWLRQAREQGQSYRQITQRLETEHDIKVVHQTVKAWCGQLGIDEKKAS